jgi:Rrf2 family protein
MTLLSRKADYALLILSHLFHHKQGGNARILADQFNLSRPFVANILKDLCHHGFVTSQRGVKGGYTLARDLSQVTLAEVLVAMEDGFQLTTCTEPDGDTHSCGVQGHCPIQQPMGEIHNRIMDMLKGVKLSELFVGTQTPAPRSAPLPMLSMVGCCGSTPAAEAAVLA